MAYFDIDIEKVKDCADLMDKEITKYNDAMEKIAYVLSHLTDPTEGCMAGPDANSYVSSVTSSNEKQVYETLGTNLGSLTKALNDVASDLETTSAKCKIGG